MNTPIDGNALVYCEGAFNTPNGKTAHGLVRFTHRYNILGVIDSRYAGQDAGDVLDQKKNQIPIFQDLSQALAQCQNSQKPLTFVIGIAPDGGRLPAPAREVVLSALKMGMNVDSGLHDFITDDPEFVEQANKNGCQMRDVRKTPPRSSMHFFSGKISEVNSLKIAILGTDSAVGKRTTAWLAVNACRESGMKAELVGTGQTAWLQGAKYSMIMDSCINDFVSGEIEHAVHEAWKNESPDVIIIEGQGSLLNPAYPGGFEILAAGRPDYIILQHAPKRLEYDGFPGYPLHPLKKQIRALEIISGKKVIAITINHENMTRPEVAQACKDIEKNTGLPAYDVLWDGAQELIHLLKTKIT